MSLHAVFIDRDGTIGGNDNVIYPGDFELFPGVLKSLKELKKSDVLLCSFTNQPGISMGEVTFESFTDELRGFGFDRVYICPHQHHEGCACRKPSPGMLMTAAKDNNLDLSSCVVIGDRWTDLLAADAVGCKKILVKTGSGAETFNKYINNQFYGRWSEVEPDFVAENINEAVKWLLTK